MIFQLGINCSVLEIVFYIPYSFPDSGTVANRTLKLGTFEAKLAVLISVWGTFLTFALVEFALLD